MATMKRLASRLALAALAVASSGCIPDLGKSLHQVSLLEATNLAGVPSVTPVEVSATQFVVLSFSGNTDYADEAYEALLRTCPQGRIVNITARYSTDLGIFAYRNKLVLRGYCIGP